jgi:NAD(P)H-dependent flavin oxidoreductase YrpB (nitropropane dioxygenase family)
MLTSGTLAPVPSLLDTLGVELPVFQAGMGGGIDGHRLAAAVSEAGGLGTIGTLDPARLRKELGRARQLTAKPLAVNILLPFARAEHWAVAEEADAVVTFWGQPTRRTRGVWLHQCGDVAEAKAARAAGADAVIAQGVEAGGHVRGHVRALDLLEQMRRALPNCPVIVAGGIAGAEDVRRALEAGASGVAAGTRFLLSDESRAHPDYKRRLLSEQDTVLTDLFGLGWPARHRVVANAATERWLREDGRAPRAVTLAHRLSAPVISRVPLRFGSRFAGAQNVRVPLFGPSAPVVGSEDGMVDVAPLYAGETVARIVEIRPAGDLVRELAG